MTARLFSILRRAPGLIDFVTPLKAPSTGVERYRLKVDTTPHGSFSTTAIETGRYGFVDPSVAGGHNVIQPGENVRIIFKPSNYGLTDNHFWLKLVYIDGANAEMVNPAPSAPTLVLPPFSGPLQSGFDGTAPLTALQIDLPRAMENFRIRNLDTTNPLMVSFQEGGPEITVPAGEVDGGFQGNVSSIWVRGVGGSVPFSTTFTYAFPR